MATPESPQAASRNAPASIGKPARPITNTPLVTPRRALAGLCLLAGLLIRIAQIAQQTLVNNALDSLTFNPVGYAMWLGVLLLLPDLPRRARIQAGSLAGIGASLLVLTWLMFDTNINWLDLPNSNGNVVTMLVGVSFIGLVSGIRRHHQTTKQPATGKYGLTGTWLGVHLLGSVLNLSALFMIGDRLSRHAPLTTPQVLALNRGFCAAAFWSPFFAAMAVVMGLAPQLSYPQVAIHGLVLATCSALLSLVGIARRFDLSSTLGFSMSPASLFMPISMAGLVMVFHYQLTPALPILAIITFLLPGIALLLNLTKGRRWTATRFKRHTLERLPAMRGEISLFLCAGLLTQGLTAFADGATNGSWQLFSDFGPIQASISFIAIITSSLVGLHPIIGISVLASVTELANENQQTLFALACLAAWGVGTSVGPLSGTNLSLQGRYGISGSLIMRQNLTYASVMSLLVIMSLWIQG
ncbi:hypothetical protein [Halomonas halocynthiae]|uniref:hypothetical protein n=1 Tax=Halomonas halocynthiae TaxID=176290 RepID=UPI0004256EF6|nr:hypothetical protein [Halomonas halocynthiae]